jgi:hypothetical protein
MFHAGINSGDSLISAVRSLSGKFDTTVPMVCIGPYKRSAMKISRVIRLSLLWMSSSVFALAGGAPAPFPPYLSDGFDYAAFTRFDAPTPPKTVIYQSNGFMALQEGGFGGQKIIIPVVGSTIPSNSSDRLVALEIDPPVFVDSSQRTYSMADSPAKRSMTYFADRTVYRVAFDGGPEVSLTVYPVYGKPDAVLRIKIVQSRDPILRAITQNNSRQQFGLPNAPRHTRCFNPSLSPGD